MRIRFVRDNIVCRYHLTMEHWLLTVHWHQQNVLLGQWRLNRKPHLLIDNVRRLIRMSEYNKTWNHHVKNRVAYITSKRLYNNVIFLSQFLLRFAFIKFRLIFSFTICGLFRLLPCQRCCGFFENYVICYHVNLFIIKSLRLSTNFRLKPSQDFHELFML